MWSQALTLERRVMAGLGALLDTFQPVAWLWPWFVGNLLFAAFLASDQGAAVAAGFPYESVSGFTVAGVVGASFVVVLLSCLLATSVSGAAGPHAHPPQAAALAVRLTWAVGLASAPGLLFGVATGSRAAFATVLLLLLGSVATLWKARGRPLTLALTARRRVAFALVLLGLACLPLLAGVAVVLHRPDFLDDAGPLLLSLYGLCALSSSLGNLVVAIPACSPRPWLARILLLGWMAYGGPSRPFAPDKFNPLLEDERLKARAQAFGSRFSRSCGGELDQAINSLTARLDLDPAAPIFFRQRPAQHAFYLVSAEGGGIRAAYWTAVGLAELDVATANAFGDQVASMSGVSGGSLGIATWLAARELPGLTAQQRLHLIETFLSGDFLSPLLAGFFFLDGPRLLFGTAWATSTRDQVFEFAVSHRWTRLAGSNFFARPVASMCLKSFKQAPLIVFNATDALSGVPIRLGNTRVTPTYPMSVVGSGTPAYHYLPDLLKDLSVAQAVHLSARFPFLSPGAEIGDDVSRRLTEEYGNQPELKQFQHYLEILKGTHIQVRAAVLVDGGYFDNSGLAVTRDFLETVELARKSEIDNAMAGPFRQAAAVVLHFENNPATGCLDPARALQRASPTVRTLTAVQPIRYPCESDLVAAEAGLRPRPLQWLTTPFEAMLSVRESHATQELALVETLQMTREGRPPYRFSLARELSSMYGRRPPDIIGDPLSWRANGLERYVAGYENWLNHAAAQGKLSQQDLDNYVERLNRWQRVAAAYEGQLACAKRLKLRQAPLGWILDRDNRELLSCAAARAAIEITAQQPPDYHDTVEPERTAPPGGR